MIDRRQKILVVDDLPDWRKTLKGLLADEGYEVEVADSLSSASTSLKGRQFDLVVADVRLDESDVNNTDGLELATMVKEQYPGIKVILITGYETQAVVERAMIPNAEGESLVADFITKAQISELLQIVSRVLMH